jgi:hypothetical protein
MPVNEFEHWMTAQHGRFNPSTRATYRSRLGRLERRYNLDLDREWSRDGFAGLIHAIQEERERIETGSRAYRDLSSDISRLRAYAEYCGAKAIA